MAVFKIRIGDERVVESLQTIEKESITTLEELLSAVGLCNPYSLYIIFSMAFLWFLSSMPVMSPAYLAPAHSCENNCTFTTVQDEFNLKKEFVDPAELTSSIYFFGNFMLGQIYCVAADRIGRRPVLVWSVIVSGISGIIAAFAPTFELLLFGRFIQGSFFNAITMVNWVLCCESIAFSGHAYASVLFGICWVFGYCSVTPIAIYYPSWRAVQLITSIPSVIFGVLMLLTLPESVAFLVSRKKKSEIEQWIRKAEQFGINKINCDINKIIENEANISDLEKSFWDSLEHIVRNKELMGHIFIQTILWIVDFMIYNGLSLTSTSSIRTVAIKSPLLLFCINSRKRRLFRAVLARKCIVDSSAIVGMHSSE